MKNRKVLKCGKEMNKKWREKSQIRKRRKEVNKKQKDVKKAIEEIKKNKIKKQDKILKNIKINYWKNTKK